MEIDFGDFIEYYLDVLGINYSARIGNEDDYYVCNSPILMDNNPSFQIFSNGFCSSYNGDINGRNRISLKECCKLTGHLNLYIEYLLEKKNIPSYKLNQYREILIKKSLKEKIDYKIYKKYVDLFGEVYLSQSDVLQTNEVTPLIKTKFEKSNKTKKKKSKIIEVDQSKEEYQNCLEYIKLRGLDFVEGRVEPVTLTINSWRVSGIALRHKDNHQKYRLLNDKMRYISTGTFGMLYEVRNEGSKIAIVCEGQLESESIKDMVDCDIYSMANCNSIPKLEQLDGYDRVCVLVDGDNYKKIRKGLREKLSKGLSNKINVIRKFNKYNTTRICNEYSDKFDKALDLKSKKKCIDYNYALINFKEELSKTLNIFTTN